MELISLTIDQIINKAQDILFIEGVEFSYSGSSESNGKSVYFKAYYQGKSVKVRFSDHSLSNRGRLETEVCFDVYRINNTNHIAECISQIGYMLGLEGYAYGKVDCEMPNGKILKAWNYYKI